MAKPYRWEAECLADDPFAGDFGDGEACLSDKMVTNRKGGICHTCAGQCEPRTRNRVRVESDCDGLTTFRWCVECCFTMAVYPIRPSLGDARFEMGEQRRASLARNALSSKDQDQKGSGG